MRWFLWLLLGVWGLAGWSFGAVEVPAGHVLDDAGLFDRDPGRLAAMEERLVALEEEYGMPVYVAIYGGLLGSRIREQTRELYDGWVGREADGVVVVWDSDTGDLEFGLPRAGYVDGGGEKGRETRLPDVQTRPVVQEVIDEVGGIEDKADYAERLVVVLAGRMDWLLREERVERGVSTGKVLGATIFLVAVLGGMAWCAGRLVRRPEVEVRRKCYFPDVLVGSRLGASFGGGRVAVVDYMREDAVDDDEDDGN